MAESTVKVVFLGDAKSLRSALKDVDNDTDKLEKTSKKAEAGFGNLKTALIGLGVGAGIKAVIGQASDLNETVSKTRTIFGDSSRSIEAWGDGAAQAMGLSKNEALNAASTFGNLFDQLGIGTDVAAKMSTEMVQLAADFASFHGADTVEVTEAMTAAFRGEYDALQKFVPTINAAAVEQEALAMSGKKTTKELTDQEKALAVNSLMMKNAGDAAGDFSRTSDSLANQQRKLGAEFKNVQAELGQRLMPVATKVVGVFTDVLQVFSAMPAPLQNVVLGLGAAAGAFVLVGKGADSIAKAKDAIVPAFEKIRGAMTTTGADGTKSLNNLGKATAALGGVMAGVAIAATIKHIADNVEKLTFSVDAMAKVTGETLVRAFDEANSHGGKMVDGHKAFDEAIGSNIGVLQRFITELENEGRTAEASKYREVLADRIEKEKRAAEAAAATTEATKDEAKATDDAAASSDAYKAASKELDTRLGEVGKTLEELHGHLTDADSAMSDLMDSTNGVADADAAWNESLRNLTDAVKENGTSVNTHTEAGNANREALDKVVESAGKWLGKIYEQEGASQNFNRTSGAIRTDIINTMRQLGFGKDDIDKYVKEWDKVPEHIVTTVEIKYRITTIKELMDEQDKMWGSVASAANVQQTSMMMQDAGETITAGFHTGVANGFGIVEDTVASYAEMLPAPFKGVDLTGIGSAKMAGLGDGMGDGWRDEVVPVLDDASSGIAPPFEAIDLTNAGASITGSLSAGLSDGLDATITMVQSKADRLEEIFSQLGKSGGQFGDIPLDLDIQKLAAGFASGGGGFSAAMARLQAAVQEGLVASIDMGAVTAAMVKMFVDQYNKTQNQAWLTGMEKYIKWVDDPAKPGQKKVESVYGNHGGGVAGVDRPMSLSRPGGLRNDEYLRVLQKGEGVFTPGQMAALGGGGGQSIVINIYNPKIDSPGRVDNLAASMSRELAVALRGSVA